MNKSPASGFVFTLDTVTGSAGDSLPSPRQWLVPLQGGTLGRSPECSWSIADPDRVMSRQHAKVDCEQSRCHWTDLGSNSTLLNGKPLSQGQRVALNVGDVLKIGDFLIRLDKTREDWSALSELEQPVLLDPLASLWPGVSPDLSIDDLLSGLESPVNGDTPEDRANTPVLAQRMYVGSQQGAELPRPPPLITPTPVDPAEVEQLKALLKTSVQGVMQLLQARRAFQEEMGGPLTTLSSKGNNPLKFSATADEALGHLLGQPSTAYLSGEQALVQACQDLLAYMQSGVEQSQAVMAQVQSVLHPQSLQDELNQSGTFKLELTASRKARLWDLYCARFNILVDTWN